ncbi:MAG: DUF2281 domain-containing protein [Bacillota bacterium]
MFNRDVLFKELENLSEPVLAEVLDFVRFLKAKDSREKFATAQLSEGILAKDWLRPEEDEAWADL